MAASRRTGLHECAAALNKINKFGRLVTNLGFLDSAAITGFQNMFPLNPKDTLLPPLLAEALACIRQWRYHAEVI